jgi:hypothetical protein
MTLTMALLVASGVGSAQQPPTASAPRPSQALAVAPEPLAALEKMGGFLRTLQAFTIRADTTIDEVLAETGQKIQFGGVVDFRARPPDRLRVDVASDRKHRQFFYDGTTVTVYGPRTKYYATFPAPPTIRDTLAIAAQRYGVEVPLADLFLWGTDKAQPEAITAAIYVGPSRIGGVACDHYAFQQEDVDWQIWIEQGATPLPRKLVITTKEEEQPQYSAVLEWNLAPTLDNSLFTFVPPAEAQKIIFQEVQTQP